jgi:tripartite-type tricarboxylate transporter receptor subunit TctC
MRRRAFLGAVAALVATPAATVARAAYPSRPLRMVVPFPPGGNADLLGRLVAERLGLALGQPVVVENRPGASATVGTDAVARSAPDGHTLVLANNLGMATAPLLYGSVAYRPLEDFVHVFLIGAFPNALLVRADHAAASLEAFIAMARAAPGRMTYGSAGPGSAGHLVGEMLAQRIGAELVHVPYKGVGPAMTDLVAGRIDAMFDGMPTATVHARSGRVRMLAVTGPRRATGFPEVPTLAEAAPGVEGSVWFGVSVPAGTPREAIERLEREGRRLLGAPDMRARLAELGVEGEPMFAADFGRFVDAEICKWEPVIRTTGLKAQ